MVIGDGWRSFFVCSFEGTESIEMSKKAAPVGVVFFYIQKFERSTAKDEGKRKTAGSIRAGLYRV